MTGCVSLWAPLGLIVKAFYVLQHLGSPNMSAKIATGFVQDNRSFVSLSSTVDEPPAPRRSLSEIGALHGHQNIALGPLRSGAQELSVCPNPPEALAPGRPTQAGKRFDLRWLLSFLAVPAATGVALGVVSVLRRNAAQRLEACLLNLCQNMVKLAPPLLPPLAQGLQVNGSALSAACGNTSTIHSWAQQGMGYGPCASTQGQQSRQLGGAAAVIVGSVLICTGVVLQRAWAVRQHNAALLQQAHEGLRERRPGAAV